MGAWQQAWNRRVLFPDWKPDVDSTHIGDEQVMATSAQVQQLYIALLGRAADKPGLDWWLENINGTEGVPGERTLEEAATAFTTSEEFAATYGSLQGEDLVRSVYTNLFERAPSAEEVAYWVADGRPADQLLSAFLTYASPADQTVINNKVTVAQYYTDAAGNEYDLAAAAEIIDGVTGDVATVGAALQDLPVTNATLTAALGTWEAAKDTKATFLAGLGDLDNNPTTATTDAQVKALIVPATVGAPVNVFNANEFSVADLAVNSSVAAQEAAFTAARADFNVKVATQQAKVTDAQTAVTELNDARDVNAYIAAVEAATATQAALNPAVVAAAGAIASYEALSTTKTEAVDVTQDDYTVTAGVPSVADGLAALAEVKDDALVLKADITETTNPGVTALLAAINGDIAAQVADYKADQAVIVAAGATDATLVGALITAKADLATLQAKSEALEKAISDAKDAYSLNAQLDKLDAAIDTAFSGIKGANLLEGVSDTPDALKVVDDLFIFNGGNQTIGANFAAGDQVFIGSDYSLVTLTADQSNAGVGNIALGSASALEVFWDAAKYTLYVEKEAFSGNAAGAGNFETILLTGVNAELEMNGGFVQLA